MRKISKHADRVDIDNPSHPGDTPAVEFRQHASHGLPINALEEHLKAKLSLTDDWRLGRFGKRVDPVNASANVVESALCVFARQQFDDDCPGD